MRIRKTSTNNEYIRAGGVMVRNFTKNNVLPVDISNLFSLNDQNTILKNEEHNKKYANISDEKFHFPKILIVSDGYLFAQKQTLISKFPQDIAILAVNGALREWNLIYGDDPKSINAYIINNPYTESLQYLPADRKQYYPVCLASTRTNLEFCKKYKGDIYTYNPTPLKRFGYRPTSEYYIDDYRNPVCAAIDFAFHFGVEKLMLFCCDDSFEDKKEYATKLSNGLWTYPQHLTAHQIIDVKLYWLTHQKDRKVSVSDFSNGGDYANCPYISDEEAVIFFSEEGTVNEESAIIS